MNSVDAAELPYDLGVLFVHGIGQNVQGETLLSFGEPLCEAVQRLVEPQAPVAGGAPTQPAPVASVKSAWLSDPDEGPARAELQIESAAYKRSRWLMAEAWWAEKFPTPTFYDIAMWCFGVLPATVIAHFDRRFRRAGYALAKALGGGSLSRTTALKVLRLLIEGLVVALALTLTPLLLVGVAAILVLGSIPLKVTRDMAAATQRVMATTIGDSFVFMRQRIAAATICSSVLQQLEWLSKRCRRIAVVAHSQGGAITHRVLRGAVTAPCDLFISFGSGLAKLADIEAGDASRARAPLWAAVFCGAIAVAATSILLWRKWTAGAGDWVAGIGICILIAELGAAALTISMLRQGVGAKPTQTSSTPASPSAAPTQPAVGLKTVVLPILFAAAAMLLIAFIGWIGSGRWSVIWRDALNAFVLAAGLSYAYVALSIWHAKSRRSLDAAQQWAQDRLVYIERYELRNRPDLSWYDLYSTADPVPNGHLLDHFEPRNPVSIEVRNSHSFLFDHTSYWQAQDDFVQRVAHLLLRAVELPTRAVNFDAPRRRKWRVQWLVLLRWVTLISAVVLGACFLLDTPAWIDWLQARLLKADPNVKPTLWSRALANSFPALVAAALWLLARGVLCWRWDRWQRAEAEDYFADRDYRWLPKRSLLLVLAPASLLGWAAYAALGPGGLLSVQLALIAIAAAVRFHAPTGRWLQRISRSGSASELEALDLAALQAAMHTAERDGDVDAMTELGEQLWRRDRPLAERALRRAAFDLKSANAAWRLGRLYEGVLREAHGETERAHIHGLAMEAYATGAVLGDAMSARWAAYLSQDAAPGQQEAFYRRAYELGDAAAAHSVGMSLMAQAGADAALQEQARNAYEDGVRRGDPLSAFFLAQHYESIARAATGEQARQLKERAAQLYKAAFDLGDVYSARKAGDLLRSVSNIAAARRAYTLGMRLRDAGAALQLAKLEAEVEQNHEAALEMYATAIRLDSDGYVAAHALLAIGALLEKQERPVAAAVRYREALEMPNGRDASARGGVALARILESDHGTASRVERRDALRRAMTLAPEVAADSYVEFIKNSYDPEDRAAAVALTDEQLAGLSAHGLVTLAELFETVAEDRVRRTLERAFAQDAPNGSAAAAAALYVHLRGVGESEAANNVMQQALARRSFFAGKVVEELIERGAFQAANELKVQVDALEH